MFRWETNGERPEREDQVLLSPKEKIGVVEHRGADTGNRLT